MARMIEKILAHYGSNAQKVKCIEELNELSIAIAKDVNGKGDVENLIEEMADVFVMLAQMKIIYLNGDEEKLSSIIKEKIERTLERIKNEVKKDV